MPKKKQPHTMLLRLDPATAEALNAYIAGQTVPPKRNPVVVTAVRRFLAEHGYWPPKPSR
jgi:hypothetical protein